MKKVDDKILIAHLQKERAAQAAATSADAASGLILHTPPVGPNVSFDEMFAAEDARKPDATSLPVVTNEGLAQVMKAKWELVNDDMVEGNGLISIELIDDSPFQTPGDSAVRYAAEGIDELAHTMATAGQLEPVIVRRKGKRYELIAGHRRLRAARNLGWTELRAVLVKQDDAQAERSVMVHNEGRVGNCDYVKAKLYQRSLDRGFNKNQTDVARMFATSQTAVSRRLSMLTLPNQIIEILEEKNDLFSMDTAHAIKELVAKHPNPKDLEIIVRGVKRIRYEGATEASVKPWVTLMLTKGALSNDKPEPKVIADAKGRKLYSAAVKGRDITINLSAKEIDADSVLARIVEFLQKDVETQPGE